MFKPRILLLYTGGTIGMVKDPMLGALKAFDFGQLLDKIPELQLLDCLVETVSFSKPIDSSNMNVAHWVDIAEVITKHYHTVDGFVVLHGSDTMSYSASALSFMLQNLDKPIVFTGSQLPIGDLRTDAKENLITAIQVAALRENGRAAIREVCLYFEYKLYRGNRTTKINADHFNAFASPNYPSLAESGVHLKVNKEYLLAHDAPLKMSFCLDSHVMIIKLFPGLNELVLHAVLNIKGLKGLVLETYGAGNAPSADWFVGALSVAIQGGLHVVNVTQCSGGSVSMGQYETSARLQDIGVISGRDITTEAAVTKIMYLLGLKLSGDAFKVLFESDLCGEMS
jgi:L-asparaginase